MKVKWDCGEARKAGTVVPRIAMIENRPIGVAGERSIAYNTPAGDFGGDSSIRR